MKRKIKVKCPQCSESFDYYSSEFRPFCSDKCKMIDLGHWFDESYNIKGQDYSVYIEDPEKLIEMLEKGSEAGDEDY